MTKERVFQIMGKYYGNAYYRSAIRLGIPEDDLRLSTEILDEVNALGYCFSNLSPLKDMEDIRFVPIVLANFERFESVNYKRDLIFSVRFPSYHAYVPQLVYHYENPSSARIREDISQCLFHIHARKYVPDYLRLVYEDDYCAELIEHDYLVDLLCRLRVKEVLPKLLELLQNDSHHWFWTFLTYAAVFQDPSVIPILEPYAESGNYEVRSKAQKAIQKLTTP